MTDIYQVSNYTPCQIGLVKGEGGRDGIDGINGVDGKNGRDGKDGLRGLSGSDGKSNYQLALDAGFIGSLDDYLLSMKGDKGLKGDTGADAAIDSLTVSTGAAGTSASVVTGGTPISRTFALTIPRGDKGETGDKGDGGSFLEKSYKTYAEMELDKPNLTANISTRVSNDSDTAKNGSYTYDGTVFTRSQYDSKVVTDKIITDTAIAVQEAINNTAVEGGVLADTFVTVTAKNGGIARTQAEKNKERVTPDDFGIVISGESDDIRFRKMLAASDNIVIPAGDYTFTNTDKNKMLVINGSQNIHFERGVRIFFSHQNFPLFNIVNGDGGSISGDPEFIFTGTAQLTDGITANEYKSITGVTEFIGGNYELRTVVMRINCNNHHMFDGAKFRSQTSDVEHGLMICIYDRGDGTTQSVGNTIGSCTFRNHIHGILSVSQKDFNYYGDYISSKRWGHASMAPGHVVYLSGSAGSGYLDDGYMGNIIDLGQDMNFDRGYNLAPLAPKGCRNVTFGNITSVHFNGLVQTLSGVSGCIFGKWVWIYTGENIGGTPVQVLIDGEPCEHLNIDITAICPKVNFRIYDSPVGKLNNSTVKLKIKCSQNVAESTQLLRMYGSGNDISIDYEPTTVKGAGQFFPIEEFLGSTGNTYALTVTGKFAVPMSCRTILKSADSKLLLTSFGVRRAITEDRKDNINNKVSNVATHKFNEYIASSVAETVSSNFTILQGSYLLTVSAYVGGGDGRVCTFIVNYESASSLRNCTLINDSSSENGVAISSIAAAVDRDGMITLNVEKTTDTGVTLNVSLVRVAELY